MHDRPLPLIAVLLTRALLVVVIVAGLGAMHALATAPSASDSSAGAHRMVAGPASAVAEGAELLADGTEAIATAAWSAPTHRSASDHLMSVLAACLAVLLLVVVALAQPVARLGSQARAVARAPAARAPARSAPRLALPAVLRI